MAVLLVLGLAGQVHILYGVTATQLTLKYKLRIIIFSTRKEIVATLGKCLLLQLLLLEVTSWWVFLEKGNVNCVDSFHLNKHNIGNIVFFTDSDNFANIYSVLVTDTVNIDRVYPLYCITLCTVIPTTPVVASSHWFNQFKVDVCWKLTDFIRVYFNRTDVFVENTVDLIDSIKMAQCLS